MKVNFVVFINSMDNPLMAYTSAQAYLNYKNIDVQLILSIFFCKRRKDAPKLHTNITDYTTEYIFGKTVDDIVELESIVKLVRNFNLHMDLLKDIPVPSFRNELINIIDKEAIKLSNNDVVFFSVFRYHFLYHLYLAASIKKLNKNVKIVFGGPQIINSKLTVKLLENIEFIDNIICGDVETGVFDYLTKQVSKVHYSEPLNLKELQMPDYSNSPIFLFKNQIMLTTSRNCFHKCSYCPSVYMPYKFVNIDIIDSWIKHYCDDPKVKSIYFTDAIFNSNSKRFHDILDILLTRNKGQSFYIWCHPLNLEVSHIEKLAKLNFDDPGCIVLAYDSGSKELCSRMNRPVADNIDESISLLISNGLSLFTPFIGGYPIETESDYLLTYNKTKELRQLYGNKIIIAIQSFLFIPGSPFYENYQDYNIELEYWDNKTANMYPPLSNIVKTIPRYYYGALTVDEFNVRIKALGEWR